MVELDRPDLALDWATRGIDKTSGWQIANLYDLACKLHVRADTPSEALRLRRAHHERSPSGSTYGALRSAAGACDAWHLERDAARQALERSDRLPSRARSVATSAMARRARTRWRGWAWLYPYPAASGTGSDASSVEPSGRRMAIVTHASLKWLPTQ